MTKRWLVICIYLLPCVTCFSQNKDLDFFINNGIRNSPLLMDYQNQISANAIDSTLLRATYKPQVNAVSNNTIAPVTKGWGYDEAITNGKNVSALVGVNQTIIGRGNLNKQYESIRLKTNGIANTAKISEQDLKKNITAQYIQAFGDAQQLLYLNEVLLLLKKEEDILKRLTRSNVYRQTDYLTFLVTLQQQELTVKQLYIQYRSDIGMLNYLCGIVDTSMTELSPPALDIHLQDENFSTVFLKQYEIDSLVIRNKKALVDYSYRPKVNLFGDAGYNSSLLLTPYKNFGYSVGFSISVPIYDGRQRRMQYRKLNIEENSRYRYKQFATDQYHQQTALLHQQLEQTSGLTDDIQKQIGYSDALIKADAQLLPAGEVKIADLIIAINNYLTAKNLLMQNQMSKWQIMNQINYWNH